VAVSFIDGGNRSASENYRPDIGYCSC